MASQEGCSTNKSPLFIGMNYAFWKVRMKTYLVSLWVEVCVIVIAWYEEKKGSNSDKDAKLNFILKLWMHFLEFYVSVNLLK